MVDRQKPTDQFHPYQRPAAVPQRESRRALGRLLEAAGMRASHIDRVETAVRRLRPKGGLRKITRFMRKHPAAAAAVAVAIVTGVGLIRSR